MLAELSGSLVISLSKQEVYVCNQARSYVHAPPISSGKASAASKSGSLNI